MGLTNHCVIAHWGIISISGKTFVIIEYPKQDVPVALLGIVDAWCTTIEMFSHQINHYMNSYTKLM